ncbi:MAG: hypothetical protein ACP5PW_01850 [Candidatus Dormibacteria bacterium]
MFSPAAVSIVVGAAENSPQEVQRLTRAGVMLQLGRLGRQPQIQVSADGDSPGRSQLLLQVVPAGRFGSLLRRAPRVVSTSRAGACAYLVSVEIRMSPFPASTRATAAVAAAIQWRPEPRQTACRSGFRASS